MNRMGDGWRRGQEKLRMEEKEAEDGGGVRRRKNIKEEDREEKNIRKEERERGERVRRERGERELGE